MLDIKLLRNNFEEVEKAGLEESEKMADAYLKI